MTYPFSPLSCRRAALACAVALVAAPLCVRAQTPQPDESRGAQPAVAAPAAAAGWTTKSVPGDDAPQESLLGSEQPVVLTPDQISMLTSINDYLNSLVSLEGRFVQTDHRNEETRGRFYVHRPGRLRFDYASPSRLRIVSDGEYLSIEDHDLKTVDKFPLDATPIQLLLGADVNLTRDAIILDMRQDETAVVVTIKDRSGKSPGRLQLFFKRPELELYEWVITDAQGLDTRIQLADLVAGNERSMEFFQASSIELEKLNKY